MAVAAGHHQRGAAGEDARPGHDPLLDRLAEGEDDAVGAADVSYRGGAGRASPLFWKLGVPLSV